MAPTPSSALGKRRRPSCSGFKAEESGGDSSDDLFVIERKEKKLLQYQADDAAANDSSDAGSDVEEDDEIGYSEKSEPLPQFAAYDSRIPDIKHRLLRIVKNANDILIGDSCSTPEVEKLRGKAKQVLTIPDAERKMIGLVGNAGQGKSSFVNTITDISGLAKALDNGKSVTYVVTIYQRAADEQRFPFSARVEYFDILTIGRLLEEAIADWYAFYFDEEKDSWSTDEKKYRQDRAKTTLSIFRAVFRHMQEFSTIEAARATLHEICATDSTPHQRVSICVENVEKVMNRDFPDGKFEAYHEARTQDDLRDWLDPYLMEDDDGEEPVLWSFVKRVIIGVRGSRVLDHWSIADLPGLTDTHQVRVHATLNHINQCNHLFVFARLGRIVTDPTVQDLVQKYGHAFQDKLWIIATKCDENIGPEEVKDLARKQQDLKRAEAHWKQTSKALNAQVKSLEQHKKKSRNTGNSNSRLQDIASLKETRKEVDNEWWEKVVKARNKQVVPQIRREVQQHLPPDSQLQVFCISNTHYEALKDDDPQDAKFHLSAEGTGIPVLRSQLLGVAAPSNFQTLQNFISHDISVFLGGCEIWAGNKLVQGRAELISVIKQPKKAIPGAFEECFEDIQHDADEMIINILKANQSQYAGLAKAVVSENLAKRHWATLQAFIRRYGHHNTPAMRDSWNELFTGAVRIFLNGNWASFVKSALGRIAELERKALAIVCSIMHLLDREKAALGLPTDVFGKQVEARVEGLRQTFRASVGALSQALRTILIKATVDGPQNYFSQAMQPAYELCQQESGTGVKVRCLGILIGQIALGAPFAEMFDAMQEAIYQEFEPAMGTLQSKVDKTFEQIAEDFALMIKGKKESASEAPVRAKIKAWLPSGVSQFDSIKRDVQKIRARYPGEA